MLTNYANRYILVKYLEADDPLRGIHLRIDDRSHVISRRDLSAVSKCDRFGCVAGHVHIQGRFKCGNARYEGYYAGVLEPASISRK